MGDILIAAELRNLVLPKVLATNISMLDLLITMSVISLPPETNHRLPR